MLWLVVMRVASAAIACRIEYCVSAWLLRLISSLVWMYMVMGRFLLLWDEASRDSSIGAP